MRLVHDSFGAQVARRAATVLLAGLTLSACSGSDSPDGEPPARASARLGAPIRLANCRDWKKGTIRERQGTIEAIRSFAGGPVGARPGGHGAVLEDDKAYDLFESLCKPDYARGFKLYKLYARAAAFSSR